MRTAARARPARLPRTGQPWRRRGRRRWRPCAASPAGAQARRGAARGARRIFSRGRPLVESGGDTAAQPRPLPGRRAGSEFSVLLTCGSPHHNSDSCSGCQVAIDAEPEPFVRKAAGGLPPRAALRLARHRARFGVGPGPLPGQIGPPGQAAQPLSGAGGALRAAEARGTRRWWRGWRRTGEGRRATRGSAAATGLLGSLRYAVPIKRWKTLTSR